MQVNAFNIAAENGYMNPYLMVIGVGAAMPVEKHADAAERVTKTAENTTSIYMRNDPVSVIAAGNPGDAWAAFKELFNVYLYGNSAHSCYGTGTAGCATISNPVPGGPSATNQQAKNIMIYRGGVLVTP